jgi:acetate kinase
MSTALRILSLNAGSSSLKFALHEFGPDEIRLVAGAVEGIGDSEGRLWVRDSLEGSLEEAPGRFPDLRTASNAVFAVIERSRYAAPSAVGHRVAHGGPDHSAAERVDERLVSVLRRLVPLAPLQLPREIEVIEAVAARFPALPQVVCFDTAFHRPMPELAQRLPLPRALWNDGVRRYGFHGLSYEYVVETVGAGKLGRAVIAHLGSGASMAAVRDGQPLDTTMGFTPTGGFMMGTRSGDLDPGVLIHLLTHGGYDAVSLERLVDHRAGLFGVSGITSDMKTLLEQRDSQPHAAQAVDMFCYQLRKNVGALAAVLGGLDTLVFSGGIGERAAPVREVVCMGLAHLGIRLDVDRNRAAAAIISTPESACTVRVVPTDENLLIARHSRDVLGLEAVSGSQRAAPGHGRT